MSAFDEIREELLEEVSNDAHANMVDKNLPEAPASCSLTGYYKGYKVMVTQRDTNKLVKPYLENAMHAIDWMAENGFKASWNDDTNTKAVIDQSVKCGIHGTPMQLIPAGVSKTSGKPYPAFYTCKELNADGSKCTYRPPKA